MSLNKLIIDTLSDIAPTDFQYNGSNTYPHITFFEINQNAAVSADDDEKITRHAIQVDIWSLDDYTTLVKQVKDRLKEKGFTKQFETELYEKKADDSVLFHKVIRFLYFKEAI